MSRRTVSKPNQLKTSSRKARNGAPRNNLSRRGFLTAGALSVGSILAAPLVWPHRAHRFTGSIVGGNAALGHALRDGTLPPVSASEDTGIVIAGGGIAGLSAARRLQKRGVSEFTLLELESRAGGNAISGRNAVSSSPWGAHYFPIAERDSAEVRQLFEELGVITGNDSKGL